MLPLPRRAFLGARLPPDGEAFTAAGLRVADVVDGGMAATAGVRAGDAILTIAGAPVGSLAALGAALRAAGAGEAATITYVRDHTIRSRSVPVVPHPREPRTAYEAVAVGGARLRALVTAPHGAPRAAALWLQGIACESIDHGADPDAPLARLVAACADAGVLTLRVDRRGVGDSEGGPCGEVDLATDVADHHAALVALLADPRARDVPRFVIGHSVGGMVAALLAGEPAAAGALAGVIVYGTSPSTWLDCVAASTRRQLVLRGVPPDAAARAAADERAHLLAVGGSGRSAAYHTQLDALDLAGAWRRVRARVLVLHGEHDWVVGRDEQARIVDLVGADRATLVEVPGLDHLLGWHPDRASSLAAYGAGRADPALAALALAWMGVRSPR